MVDWGVVADVVAAVCFLLGSFLSFAAGVGVLRFPGLLGRLHAATKPQVLGVLLALVGLGLRLRDVRAVSVLALVGLFQLLTVPVAFHLVARAGYRTGKVDPDGLVVDELTTDLQASARDEGH
ncbi:MAG TPA: monovalent cation/H(+) antiporter subunit G [Acidimicrobiia bacterium]|jgi:multicomponent Na+:H+ antiporter subunit G|nr:monovalent cation/H(+) antiporter subunit G [Acidimicrobiia bacterium]